MTRPVPGARMRVVPTGGLLGWLNRYRQRRDDRRYVRDVEEAHDFNRQIDDFLRLRAADIAERGAARVRAAELRKGDRNSRYWRPEDVELACEVFFGDDWWSDRQTFGLRSRYRTDMTDALNAALEARTGCLTVAPAADTAREREGG